MPGTTSSLRTDPATRLADLERKRPEWQPWFRLLSEVESALGNAEREDQVSRESTATSADAPLLQGRRLTVDVAELQRLIRRLVITASELEGGTSLRHFQPSSDEAVKLIGAAVRQDYGAITALAAAHKVDPGALGSVLHLASLPLLQTAARALHDRTPQHWPHGYCPVCAAWPMLAERRGLDRSRRLRCGRCAAEWEVEWLTCVFCGERDHRQLGSLVLEDGELLKVDTCTSCRGYLKSIATLQIIPAFELLLRDLETVELDLVALDRGYRRPEGCGFDLDVCLV